MIELTLHFRVIQFTQSIDFSLHFASMSTAGASNRINRETWTLNNLQGEVVWEGREFPSVRKVQEFLDADLRSGVLSASSQIALTSYTIQAIIRCPVKGLSGLLNAFACAFFRNDAGMIDTKKLFALKLANKRSLCGRPIKKGDILWICKQCGQDNTCVQCDACFQLSDHSDHEVYFHRSSEGGGCCDCGDNEAWQERGTCSRHGLDPHAAAGVDPLSVLPASLLLGLSAVLDGTLLALLQFSISAVDGFNCPQNNPFVRPLLLAKRDESGEELVFRVHNDDIHSYGEVTAGLQQCGLSSSQAKQLTEAVDKDGSAEVCRTKNLQRVQRSWEALGANPLGLCVSVLPVRLTEAEAALPSLLGWLQHLAGSNDGLMRLVCNSFMASSEEVLQAARGSNSSSGKPMEVDLSSLFISSVEQKGHSWEDLKCFPTRLPLRGNLPSGEHSSANNGPPPSVLLSLGVDGVAPAPHSSLDQGHETTTLTRVDPFNSSNTEDIPTTPRVMFAVLMACSPYLLKPLKKAINSLVISLQQDVVFKLGYSQLLVHLYPSLLALFCHGIGTNSDSIFGTSVQVSNC